MAEDERFRLRDILGQFGLNLGSIWAQLDLSI